MWLVDPTDLTIDAAAAATIDAALATTNVELDTYLDGSFSAIAGNTAPGAGDINIGAADTINVANGATSFDGAINDDGGQRGECHV